MGGTVDGNPEFSGVRVLVVDHCRAFSEALAARLEREVDIVVVGVAETPEAAEGALDELHPTVGTVATEPGDGGKGLVLVTQARRTHPGVRWVVVGRDEEPLDLADAVVAGASGYVTMNSPVAALAEALRGAVAGLSVIPDDLLRRVLTDLDARGSNVRVLTARRTLVRRRPHGSYERA
jgi:DNA-binding NarL/FixJ family response regulator